MDRVASSFSFPFRRGAGRAWTACLLLLLVPPLGLVPLLGYSVAVTRSAAADPEAPPPPWRPLGRLLLDGVLLAAVLTLITVPFALLGAALGQVAAGRAGPWLGIGGAGAVVAGVGGTAAALLPWGILLLVLMPAAIARYARSASPLDLVDFPAALRTVRRRFATWNLVVVATVTAWTIGLCGLGLALVGVLPGIVFAILVSAHAAAGLADG